jgi:hypothetical protein
MNGTTLSGTVNDGNRPAQFDHDLFIVSGFNGGLHSFNGGPHGSFTDTIA